MIGQINDIFRARLFIQTQNLSTKIIAIVLVDIIDLLYQIYYFYICSTYLKKKIALFYIISIYITSLKKLHFVIFLNLFLLLFKINL